MDVAIGFSPNHQIIVDRFVAACQADARVVAAFLGGSYAKDTADEHSDLDLYLVTTDEAYDAFNAAKVDFVAQLGDALSLEDWGRPHCAFFVLTDGTEGELWIGQTSRFAHIHGGPYRVLLDKQNILADADFPEHKAEYAAQIDLLRELITNFWHEVGHFSKALAREECWFAYGSLEVMRGTCVNLARLRHNFADAGVGSEPYFKVEHAMPVEQLTALRATFCPLETEAIRNAGLVVLQFYREVVTDLVATHGLDYPVELERLMGARLHQSAA